VQKSIFLLEVRGVILDSETMYEKKIIFRLFLNYKYI